MHLLVDCGARALIVGERRFAVALGKGGTVPAAEKCEGDGRTPLGAFLIRAALLRPDRGLLQGEKFSAPRLPWRFLRSGDGWSDDPADPCYNQPVALPHPFHAEELWRKDGLYDAILTLDHNRQPAIPGRGSAIFLHIARDSGGGMAPTRGCVALRRGDMRWLLAVLEPETTIEIV